MIEIAICSMQESLAANGDTAPEGSWDPVREPIPDAGELAKEVEARLEAEEADGRRRGGDRGREARRLAVEPNLQADRHSRNGCGQPGRWYPDSGRCSGAASRRRHGARMSLEARLDELERRLAEIEAEWSRPEVASDPERSRALGREQAQIAPIVENHRRLRAVREQLEAARRELETETDPELQELAREIIAEIEAEEARLLEARCAVQLLPKDPNDDRDVIIEIRGGTGGEEAAIFAADLFRMYARYAERHRWKTETLSASESGVQGPARGHLRDQRPGRLQPAQVRGWRAPRPARARDRVERPHPHLDRHRGGAAQGR